MGGHDERSEGLSCCHQGGARRPLEAHLRRLDAAIAEWTKACGRSGAADAKAAEAVVERRELGKSGRAIPADLRRDLVCLPLVNHS